jgi:hypothetical protein
MGPRRMDSFGRAAGGVPPAGRPRPATPVQPRMAPQPQPRMVPQPRPVQQRPMARPATAQGYDRGYEQQPVGRGQAMPRTKERAPRAERKSKGWQVVLQFVIGLFVIAGVAAAIVALYIKYYK